MPVGLGEIGTTEMYSPAFVRKVFRSLCEQLGAKEVIENPKHKKNREMWVGATFALGAMAIDQEHIYVAPGPRNQSPDVYAVRVKPPDERGGQERRVTNLEVTEFGPHSHDSSPAAFLLRTKLAKHYTKDIAVVCYCAKPNMAVSTEVEQKILEQAKDSANFPEAWLMFSVQSDKGTHAITRMWPRSPKGLFFTPEKIEEGLGADMKPIITSSFGLSSGFTYQGVKGIYGWFE